MRLDEYINQFVFKSMARSYYEKALYRGLMALIAPNWREKYRQLQYMHSELVFANFIDPDVNYA